MKRYHKIITVVIFMAMILLSVGIGIGINAGRFYFQEWLAELDVKKTVALKNTEATTIPLIPSIDFETHTLEVDIGSMTTETIEEELTTEEEIPTTEDVVVGHFSVGSTWDKHFIYNVSVENTGDTPVDTWSVSIELPNGSQVENFWGCKCTLEGNILTVTPEEYNSKISSKGRITGIGITIISEEIATTVVQDILETTNTTENVTMPVTSEKEEYIPPVTEEGTPLSNHGKLTLDGTKIVDYKGNPYQLKGVSTHGIGWFPQYINKEGFRTLRDDWGANTIRLAMYTAEYNGYCTGGSKENLKQLIDNGVQYATDLGMYVIIDWHVLTDCDPNTYKSESITFFTEMASKYCNYDNVIYEICNEPNGGVNWNSVKLYADEVISVIRKYDSDALILVGTPTWSQDIDLIADNPVSNPYNVMYTFHFYAATHKDSLRAKLVTALESGTPAFVSEFSICDASGNGGIDYESAKAWEELINRYGLSYAGWSLSNKAETSALIKSNCSKVSGWTIDELSDTGKWLREFIK